MLVFFSMAPPVGHTNATYKHGCLHLDDVIVLFSENIMLMILSVPVPLAIAPLSIETDILYVQHMCTCTVCVFNRSQIRVLGMLAPYLTKRHMKVRAEQFISAVNPLLHLTVNQMFQCLGDITFHLYSAL